MVRLDALRRLCVALALAALLCPPGTEALAQTSAISYQGRLTDAGAPANGSFDLQFRLFDAPAGAGAQQGTTVALDAVAVASGVFAVTLDFGAEVFDGADRYLEIGVRPAPGAGAYAILSPRQLIASSPYAIQTLNAQKLGGLPASRYVATADNGNVGIGIGAATPVNGRLEVGNTSGPGVYAGSGSSVAVWGKSATFEGVRGESGSAASSGVTGYNNSGAGIGVFGQSSGGVGVRGNSTTGYGVSGTSTNQHGVYGESSGTASAGTAGINLGIGFGVFGSSAGGAGVQGMSTTGSGVVGGSASGSGVYGESAAANTLTAAAVYGKSTGSGGIGVMGEANVANASGVYAVSTSPTGFGVYARNLDAATGRALYVDGNAAQTPSFGGMVKALAEVDSRFNPPVITRCYNGVTSASSGNCGFTLSRIQSGWFRMTFGFPVSGRFFVVTPAFASGSAFDIGGAAAYNFGANYRIPEGSTTMLDIFTHATDQLFDTTDAGFTVAVF